LTEFAFRQIPWLPRSFQTNSAIRGRARIFDDHLTETRRNGVTRCTVAIQFLELKPRLDRQIDRADLLRGLVARDVEIALLERPLEIRRAEQSGTGLQDGGFAAAVGAHEAGQVGKFDRGWGGAETAEVLKCQ
jgi:hypothetical protein